MLSPEQEQHKAYRRGKVLEQRRKRVAWSAIASDLNVSIRTVRRIYSEAIAEYPASQADELRQEELTLTDDAVNNLLDIAQGVGVSRWSDKNSCYFDSFPSFKDRIEAWTAIARWAEHKAKLTGIYAATQVTFTMESIESEIARLTAQMALEAEQEALG